MPFLNVARRIVASMANPEHVTKPYDPTVWLDRDPPELQPDARKLFESYSKIAPDQVLPRIQAIRDKAWAVHPYPCIGLWRFVDFGIGRHNLYPEILSRMKSGDQIYLDVGCAFAQDIRRLVADGVDSSKCYGSDLRLEFLDLGYELFNDKETLQTKFIAADIFDSESALKELEGTVDIVGASSFFHLFNWEEQKTVARRVIKLLKPQKDSLVVGRQVGNQHPGDKPRRTGDGSRYRHNMESWRKLWKEVGDEVGVQFEVLGGTRPIEGMLRGIGDIGMQFSVRRL